MIRRIVQLVDASRDANSDDEGADLGQTLVKKDFPQIVIAMGVLTSQGPGACIPFWFVLPCAAAVPLLRGKDVLPFELVPIWGLCLCNLFDEPEGFGLVCVLHRDLC